jgi:hypothetical protein
MLRFVIALWHVAGILLLAVLVTEFGVEVWRRCSRYLRYRRPTRPDRNAAADAYAGGIGRPPTSTSITAGFASTGNPMSNGAGSSVVRR